jgi:hypothetical protein
VSPFTDYFFVLFLFRYVINYVLVTICSLFHSLMRLFKIILSIDVSTLICISIILIL